MNLKYRKYRVNMRWLVIVTLNDQKSANAQALLSEHEGRILMRKLAEILRQFVEATEALGAKKQVAISFSNPYMNALKGHIAA